MRAILLACCVLLSVASTFASSPAARAKAAVAVSQWIRDAKADENEVNSVESTSELEHQKDDRPVVYVYEKPTEQGSCPACDALARAASRDGHGWPFQIEVRKSAPFPIEGYPTLHWMDENGKPWTYLGWPGIEKFEQIWRNPVPKVQASAPYAARWTWPGNLADHLRGTHGASVGGLTHDQMELLHDQLHEGVATGNGYCPSGNCPGVRKRKKR